ncbi:uncharacterized protein JCM10292_006278 [Rhodotorula paludigena]|uniref:uncharacterized protein n=1 Tax=Rhodotorula paludigena TaxID=86838 RepID=UPI0031828E2D
MSRPPSRLPPGLPSNLRRPPPPPPPPSAGSHPLPPRPASHPAQRPRHDDAQPSQVVNYPQTRPAAPPHVSTATPPMLDPQPARLPPLDNAHPAPDRPDQKTQNSWTQAHTGAQPPASSHGGAAPPHLPARPRQRATTAGAWADAPSSSASYRARDPLSGNAGAGRPARPTRIAVPANPRPVLFVSRLPPAVTEADLRATFSPYGTITRVTLNSPSPSRSFAHVAFAQPQEALAAFHALDGRHPTLLSASPSYPASSPTMHIEFAETDEQREHRRVSGGGGGGAAAAAGAPLPPAPPPDGALFRVPLTPEPARAAAAAAEGVKAEPGPSPLRMPPPPVPAPGPSNAPEVDEAGDEADEGGDDGSTTDGASEAGKKGRKRRRGSKHKFLKTEDATRIEIPTLLYQGAPLETNGFGLRVESPNADLPPVTYACGYALPASLPRPPDPDSAPVQSFAAEMTQQLASQGLAVARWRVEPARSRNPGPGLNPAQAEERWRFRVHLVLQPEQVRERGRDKRPGKKAYDRGRQEAFLARKREAEEQAQAQGASGPPSSTSTPIPAAASSVQPMPSSAAASAAALSATPTRAPDGSLLLSIPLPASSSSLGSAPNAAKAQRAFLVQQVRRLNAQGRIVLSSRIEGDMVVVNFVEEEEEEEGEGEGAGAGEGRGAEDEEMKPPVVPSQQQAAPAPAPQPQLQPMDEDVKPVVPPPTPPAQRLAPAPAPPPQQPPPQQPQQPQEQQEMDVDDDGEFDQLATPTPEPEGARARFPLPMLLSSRADSRETFEVVDAFINEYFRRFDESRGSLELMYTPNAFFTLSLNPRVPARLQTAPVPFEPRWLAAHKKRASTPTAITNLIRTLPPGSHDLSRTVFSARTVPELHLRKKDRPPIMLHLLGDFEEFPDKVVRSFSRTFIVVPRVPGAGGSSDRGEYWVHSDQLTLGYKVPGEPRPYAVVQPPFSPSKHRVAAPVQQQLPAPQAPFPHVNRGPAAQFQPHPGVASPSTSAAASQTTRPRPPAPRRSPTPPPAPQTASTARRRTSSISAAAAPTAAAASAAGARASNDDVVILSDSSDAGAPDRRASSAASASRSPEVQRRPLPPTNAQRQQQSHAVGAVFSREEVERLVQQEVAAQMQRLAAAATGESGPAAGAGAGVAGAGAGAKRKGKERARGEDGAEEGAGGAQRVRKKARAEKEKKAEAGGGAADKARANKAKEKEKDKDKVPELGTGLGKSDGRILLTGGVATTVHGYDGRGNKLRHMIDTGSSFLAVSHIGDIVEFSCHANALTANVDKLHRATDDKFRIDDAAWADAKETLIVGYLGAREGRDTVRPPHQVILYKRDEDAKQLVDTKVAARPHVTGGVTAVTALPGSGRLRFVTGGEDKKLFLWTRSRATQEIKTENIRSEHSSMITSITPIDHQDWIVSGGRDKRVFAYDLDMMSSTWQALLPNPVMSVSTLTDPHLILARTAAPSMQFSVFDVRQSPKTVITFGVDLQPHRSVTGALSPTNMGRYYRGDSCDTIYAFPDYEQGVKLWDLRNARTAMTDRDLKRQSLSGVARSKVVQTTFRGRSELCLMEISHFSRLSIRG